jgi:SET domain-containing protein
MFLLGTKAVCGCSEGMSDQQLIQLPGRARLEAGRGPLGIVDFGDRGRGIVALEDIEHGQLIERSPVLIIPAHERLAVDGTTIFTYVFMWEHNTVEQDLYNHRGRSAIALGYTSLLSHSYAPNCDFVRHIDALLIDVFAKRAIKAGEELTIDYQMTLWFDPVRI